MFLYANGLIRYLNKYIIAFQQEYVQGVDEPCVAMVAALKNLNMSETTVTAHNSR